MSRSYQKNNIKGKTSKDKSWRRQNHKNMRRANKVKLAQANLEEDIIFLENQEVAFGDKWTWPSDDLRFWVEETVRK